MNINIYIDKDAELHSLNRVEASIDIKLFNSSLAGRGRTVAEAIDNLKFYVTNLIKELNNIEFE